MKIHTLFSTLCKIIHGYVLLFRATTLGQVLFCLVCSATGTLYHFNIHISSLSCSQLNECSLNLIQQSCTHPPSLKFAMFSLLFKFIYKGAGSCVISYVYLLWLISGNQNCLQIHLTAPYMYICAALTVVFSVLVPRLYSQKLLGFQQGRGKLWLRLSWSWGCRWGRGLQPREPKFRRIWTNNGKRKNTTKSKNLWINTTIFHWLWGQAQNSARTPTFP